MNAQKAANPNHENSTKSNSESKKNIINSGTTMQPGQNRKVIDQYNFDIDHPLGKGAFGYVYKGINTINNVEVAVKVIPSSKIFQNEEYYNLFLREIDVLRQIKSENVVQLYDVRRTVNNIYIFMEYCDGGDLENLIKTKGPFPENICLKILKQIVNVFLNISKLDIKNSKGNKVTIMHRDIKPANIIFNKGKLKIADFGFAKFVDESTKDTQMLHTILGTPLYMPPQLLAGAPYNIKCDVWSTAILIYQCMFKKLPWEGINLKDLLKNIKTIPLDFPKNIEMHNETKDLLAKMLKINEEDRLDWVGVANHPAFNLYKNQLFFFFCHEENNS